MRPTPDKPIRLSEGYRADGLPRVPVDGVDVQNGFDSFPSLTVREPVFLPRWAFLYLAEQGRLESFGPVLVHPDALREAQERGLVP